MLFVLSVLPIVYMFSIFAGNEVMMVSETIHICLLPTLYRSVHAVLIIKRVSEQRGAKYEISFITVSTINFNET